MGGGNQRQRADGEVVNTREAESGATRQQAIRETQNRAGPRFKLGTQGLEAMWEVPNLCRARLQKLRKNSKTVIQKAGFARGICFFPGVGEKADPSLRSIDLKSPETKRASNLSGPVRPN
jgi:hypothetical protein